MDDPACTQAAMLGCTGSAMFRQVVFPASLPEIFNGLRIAHGFAWILIVVGEMTGVPTGLGAVIMDGRTLSRTDLVVTGMIVIGVCGFITDRIIVMNAGKEIFEGSLAEASQNSQVVEVFLGGEHAA